MTALVTLGGSWWKEAAQRRNREQVRQRGLTYIKDEVGIIETWVRAHASLQPSAEVPSVIRERAYHDLEAAYNRIRELAPELGQPVTLQMLLSRLLFRYLSSTPAVRLLRYVYYFFLFMAVIWAFVGFSQPQSWSTGTAVIVALLTYFIVAIIPALVSARLIVFAARRAAVKRFPGGALQRP
jgi:hypothetical protein